MNKIGIVTVFKNNNYGSILQCYALQEFLRQTTDGEIVVLTQNDGKIAKILERVKELILQAVSCFFYPRRLVEIMRVRTESKRTCNELPKEVVDSFNQFARERIMELRVSCRELKKTEKQYSFFLSGSDQIWSVASNNLNPFFFLDFAQSEKKYSYATSIGADVCPGWHKKRLKRYLESYNKISVRERAGQTILMELLGKEIAIHVDPTLLLSRRQWDEVCRKIDVEDSYLYLYFLNEPSELAIRHINGLLAKKNVTVYYGPYEFQGYKKIVGTKRYLKLSPQEFLTIIKRASVVCTDSFHGTVFSAIFERVFYVYRRNYQHNMSQNDRIDTLLTHLKLESQYVFDESNLNVPEYPISDILQNDRIEARKYIEDICKQ